MASINSSPQLVDLKNLGLSHRPDKCLPGAKVFRQLPIRLPGEPHSIVVSYITAFGIPDPIEGERQTAGRHFVLIRRVGDGDCRVPVSLIRQQDRHDRKEKLALGRTNIEHSHVIRERILEVIVPRPAWICEEWLSP